MKFRVKLLPNPQTPYPRSTATRLEKEFGLAFRGNPDGSTDRQGCFVREIEGSIEITTIDALLRITQEWGAVIIEMIALSAEESPTPLLVLCEPDMPGQR